MKKIFSKLPFFALIPVLCLSACQKEYEFAHGIGLISSYNVLGVDAGNTPVLVFSNTSWTAEFATKVDWAYLDRTSGTKDGQVKFYYEQNYGRSRAVDIRFQGGGETAVIHMWQKPAIADDDVIMTLEELHIPLPASAATYETELNTNLVYQVKEFTSEVTDESGAPVSWIREIRIVDDPLRKGNCTLAFSLDANSTGADRSAKICVCHTDGGGAFDSIGGTTLRSNYLVVTQSGE